MCDIDGLLTTTRKDGNLEGHKKYYAKDHPPVKDLGQVVKEIKPSVSIICSCDPYLFDITFDGNFYISQFAFSFR